MARVTYGSEITELTGSIAGTTFQRNFSGNIARSRPNKIINPSNLLGQKQLLLSSLVNTWTQLSESNKAGWNALAAAHDHTDPWGNVRTISGYQWFLSCNLNLAVINGSQISVAPAYSLPDPPPSYSILYQSDAFLIVFSETYDPDPDTLVIYATPPVRTTSSKSRISTFVLDVGSTPDTDTIDIAYSYYEKFGYTIDQLISFQYFSIVTRICVIDPSTGFRSTYALNVPAGPLTWSSTQLWNTYPAAALGHLYIDWGDGVDEDFPLPPSPAHVHNYSDPGSHYVSVYASWSGGSAGWDGPMVGSVGSVKIVLYSTPP